MAQPKNGRKAWSQSQNNQLKSLAKQNTPTRIIGLKMGRTLSSVKGQASKLGVSLKPANQSPYNRQGR
ncbi:MAG: hypothetical protein WBB39_05120 [Candidatus Saccharimonadales bacterium]